MLTKQTRARSDGSSITAACVPSPWCTSQSRIRISRCSSVLASPGPSLLSSHAAVTATVLIRQYEPYFSLAAWCPGGRESTIPTGDAFSSTTSRAISVASVQLCIAASSEPGHRYTALVFGGMTKRCSGRGEPQMRQLPSTCWLASVHTPQNHSEDSTLSDLRRARCAAEWTPSSVTSEAVNAGRSSPRMTRERSQTPVSLRCLTTEESRPAFSFIKPSWSACRSFQARRT